MFTRECIARLLARPLPFKGLVELFLPIVLDFYFSASDIQFKILTMWTVQEWWERSG